MFKLMLTRESSHAGVNSLVQAVKNCPWKKWLHLSLAGEKRCWHCPITFQRRRVLSFCPYQFNLPDDFAELDDTAGQRSDHPAVRNYRRRRETD